MATASFTGSTSASKGTATKPNPNPAKLNVKALRISVQLMYIDVSIAHNQDVYSARYATRISQKHFFVIACYS
jgi:hypothetical protein